MRIDCIVPTARKFKARLEICEDEDEELSNIRVIRRHSSEILFL